jgi:hypothetical protein
MSAGKGDKYRPVNKEKYDKAYIRIFGLKCCNTKMQKTPTQLKCNSCGKVITL